MSKTPDYLTEAKAAYLANPTDKAVKANYRLARDRYSMSVQSGATRRFKAVR